MTSRSMALLCLGVLAALGANGVRAQSAYRSPTNDRLRFTLGFMQQSNTTQFRIDSTTGQPGTPVAAEDDLGLEKSGISGKFQAMFRAGERNRLRIDYLRIERSGFRVIDQPIAFRDVNLLAADPVQSDLTLSTVGVSYGYSFWKSDDLEIAGTFGVNALDITTRVRVQQDPRRIDERDSRAGPFPQIGVDLTWVLSHRFYIDARAQYLRANIDHFDGSIGTYEISALYRWRPNMSFGLGATIFRADLASDKTNESGYFKINTQGPELFVRIAF
jgi:hypothetical protein